MTKKHSEERSEGQCEQHTQSCSTQRRGKQKEMEPSNQYGIYLFLARNTECIEQSIFLYMQFFFLTEKKGCFRRYIEGHILYSDLSCGP